MENELLLVRHLREVGVIPSYRVHYGNTGRHFVELYEKHKNHIIGEKSDSVKQTKREIRTKFENIAYNMATQEGMWSCCVKSI